MNKDSVKEIQIASEKKLKLWPMEKKEISSNNSPHIWWIKHNYLHRELPFLKFNKQKRVDRYEIDITLQIICEVWRDG
jgi:hypothetical protein